MGAIVAWGYNGNGQCDVPAPNTGFLGVAAGGYHSLGLKAGGSIVARGAGGCGQSGWPHHGQSCTPAPNSGFVAVAGGGYHSLGLKGIGPTICPGDLNCDGVVDFDDIDLLVEALNYPGGAGWPHACAWLNGDCTGDGAVDCGDIEAFVARIGTSCP